MADITYKTWNDEFLDLSHVYKDDINNYVFDFVGAGDFDGQTIEGMSFPVQFDSVKTGVHAQVDGAEQELHFFGRGTDGYIIEPQITCANGKPYLTKSYNEECDCMILTEWQLDLGGTLYFPAVEINVTVQVKLKSIDQPIILSRTYLPDYQYLQICTDKTKKQEVIDRINAKKNLSPKTKGHTQSYDFQAARIIKCLKLLVPSWYKDSAD